MPGEKIWLTTSEVAAQLGYTAQHVRLRAKEGSWGAEKIGRDWLFSRDAVDLGHSQQQIAPMFSRERRGRPSSGGKTRQASRDTNQANHTISRSKTYISEFDVLLAHNDALKFLRTFPDDSVDLIVSSPPYNLGKEYEQRIELPAYLESQRQVLRECVRALSPTGSLCWQVGNYVSSGEIVPLDALFYRLINEELELKLRNRIVWFFEHGLHARSRFSGRYETILWFTKSDEYTFNLDSVRIPQKYPGKRHYKGPNKGQLSGNPLGKNPGDVWPNLSLEWDEALWDIPNVKSRHAEKTVHPAQYPIELIERLVLALTEEGGLVLDPYMGVGSSLIAAVLHGRRAAGTDLFLPYVEAAHQRIIEAINGTLPRRPLGTPKHQPNGRESVAKTPQEWQNVG